MTFDRFLTPKAKWAFSTMIIVLLIFPGCKYSFTGASISPDVKTVSVDFFPNQAQLGPPLLGQSFTEALRDIFLSQTNLTLVESQGDLQFEGKITNYRSDPVAVGANETANLDRLTITVKVKFTNTVDPKQSFDRSFKAFKDYPGTSNLSDVESELIDEINALLVQSIFDQSVSNW